MEIFVPAQELPQARRGVGAGLKGAYRKAGGRFHSLRKFK